MAGKVCRVAASGAVHRKAEGHGSYWTYRRGPAVLVQRRGTDGLELTTGQHGLEDAGGVDRAL
ncbi:hypothetical protein AB0D97_22070, partial [Streptomyces roseus]|uniref:hypothetical protein n=1 Tax=Streptomyces roseus TaxID=66430 RepID=UPI0033EAF8C6